MTQQSQSALNTKLQRIASHSSRDAKTEFRWLMPQVSVEHLVECFHALDGKKALGIDGVSKEKYGRALQANLNRLVDRMKSMSYRPQAMKLVEIPKADGTTRPISIACTEDKLVETLLSRILAAIYEPHFLPCSYGFREGRNAHQAIRHLHQHLFKSQNCFVIDIDLENYFGTIEHDKMMSILSLRIKDKTFLRYISRFLKVGNVSAEGGFKKSTRGVPQGSILGPILSNIYAHYCLDKWVMQLQDGPSAYYRFADDLVVCFSTKSKALSFKTQLEARLTRCGLKFNERKTRIANLSKKEMSRGVKTDTFCFLGFEFYLSRSHKGVPLVKVKTDRKRYSKKLKGINDWCRKTRNLAPMPELWRQLTLKLKGYVQYFSVSFNTKIVLSFVRRCEEIFYKWMNKRSQRRSLTWAKFRMFMERVGKVRVILVHPLF